MTNYLLETDVLTPDEMSLLNSSHFLNVITPSQNSFVYNYFFIAILCNLIDIAKKFERYINKMEDVINRPIPLGTIVKGTILYGAAFWGANSATLDYLLRLGANPNIVDIAGQTPLHIAITRLNTEIS